ncbi:MAG: DMT family transporter [Acetobacteraceae bacterium]|nr:DMT family transporter [Acetobacteraceae bacterium]
MPLRHDIRRGAALMVTSHALFTGLSAIIKLLGDAIPVAQLMFFRSALALPVVAVILMRGGGLRRGLRTKRLGGHAARACTGTMAQACSFYALTVLPLAVQTALGYTTPLFVTVLAIVFLKERVGVHRWSAVAAGFCGVLVIAAGQGVFGAAAPVIGVIAAVAQGLFSAATTMLVRQLSATESSATITMYQSLLMTLFTLVALPFVWVTPTAWQLLLLVLVGLIGGVAQWMLTEAWASAQVSAVAPYSYSALVWAMGLGFVIWGEVPGLSMLAGSALIVFAGLYILHREIVRRRQREAAQRP